MEIIIYLILLALAIPTGLFLARLCKEELKDWNYRFKIFSTISLLLAIASYLSDLKYKLPISITLLFMTITFIILIKKS